VEERVRPGLEQNGPRIGGEVDRDRAPIGQDVPVARDLDVDCRPENLQMSQEIWPAAADATSPLTLAPPLRNNGGPRNESSLTAVI
jgi:hypothetical protein